MKILSGTSNTKLSKDISKQLKLKLVNTNIKRFSDGEIYIEIKENIRGNSVFVIQSTCNPANDNLMELLLVVDALRRSSAKNITAVIPYFGYARQDRKVAPRTSISAKVVANLITNAGASRVVTVDLHAGQIQGFFDMPVDNLFTTPLFAKYIKKKFKNKNLICVSPDVGGVQRTRGLATRIKADLAIIDKRRPAPGKSQVMNIIGNVKGKTCIIVDDIIDSGGTIINAVEALKKSGAIEVYVFITHAVLSGEAIAKIKNLVCVSPDVGGVQRTRGLATKIKADLAIIDKRRPEPGKSQVMNIIGDVRGKNCIIIDDIIDSGGTIINAVEALKKAGAIDVYVFITHAVLSGDAAKKIQKSKIKKLIITDTIDNSLKIKNNSKIEVISIAPLMAEAISRISNSTSVSDLFN